MKALGIDIGGTGIKGAPVDLKTGELLAERERVKTPDPAQPGPVAEAVKELCERFAWEGPVGIGFPGIIKGSTTHTAANLHRSWIGMDLGEHFGNVLPQRPVVLNDADAAGIAEMRFGAGKGENGVVLVLTFGTGIGSCFFNRGHFLPNAELGHLWFKSVVAEKYVSAGARKAEGLSWEGWAARLDEFLSHIDRIFSPDLVIIGGGVAGKTGKWLEHSKPPVRTAIAKLGNLAGIIGAALAGADSSVLERP
ncbi:MAG: ROK family protein [Puniceicoccaceae bacterium]|nr:MAG: ROK family protein [Puniceicoccaceae bacterium]